MSDAIKMSFVPAFGEGRDIVDRLRDGARMLIQRYGVDGDEGIAILKEAADIIEKLRSEVKTHGGTPSA